MTEQDKKEYEEWLAKALHKREYDETDQDFAYWLFECVDNELSDMWSKHCQSYDFKTEENYVPYGDTQVYEGSYITDESDEACREYFEGNVTPEDIIDELKISPYFKECLEKMIKHWAWNKDLEV